MYVNVKLECNTLTVTFDDICKLVASVNITPIISNKASEETNKFEHVDKTIPSKVKQSEDLDLEDMDAFN